MSGPIRVLIVEDERLIAENSAIILRSLGYDVAGIRSNVAAAIEDIEADPPDIVLIDILLKGETDGITFAELLRSKYDIPFVYVTATAEDSILERAKLTSPYGYVVKPFNERDLHSNIEMALYKFDTESKIQHVNEMLYALNEINQLGQEVDNAETYLEKLCQILLNSPSMVYVWSGLVSPELDLDFSTQYSKANSDEMAAPLRKDQSLADCIRRGMVSSEPVIGECTEDSCEDCGISDLYPGRPLVTVRIYFEDHIYGVISTVVLPRLAKDPEFLRLFAEVGNKAGVVIHNFASKAKMSEAQLALARIEERFKRFTELADDMIIVHDMPGKLLYINPSGQKLIGYSLEEAREYKLDHFVAKRSLAEMDERMKQRDRGLHETLRYETYIKSRDGEEILVEMSSNPILENGKIQSFLLIGRDMRERKRQEAELEKLSSVVAQSPVAILITDGTGLITYVNPSFTTMTGWRPDEVIGKFPAILKTDDITDDIATDLITTTRGGEVWRGELKTRRSNDDEFWINATVSCFQDEYDQNNFIGIIEDITDKRQAAHELKVSKQSYEDIFNSTSDAIYILDESGTFIDVNQGATKMYGMSHDELVGKTPADVSADGYNDLEEVKGQLEKAFAGEHVGFEFWGQRKSGEVFPKEVHINRVNYFGQQVLLATSRDITQRMQSEAELKEAAKRAEESERVKGFFLANMSHEIRTPLTSIVGYIDLIFGRIKSHLSDMDKEYFDIIRRNSDRLTRAVHSIIDLSQIEAGVTKVEKGSVNINQLVDIIYNDYRVAASDKKLDFSYHAPSENFWVMGDKELLQTAISNLVDNAITYTEEGKVDITLRSAEDNTCDLIINDTGIGISKNSLSSIFDSFNQESMGYTKNYQGLGLGLTLAKKNFELHNIKIDVESEKGAGSSFTVRFPDLLSGEQAHSSEQTESHELDSPEEPVVAPPPIPEPIAKEPPPEPPVAPRDKESNLTQILIVEDDENAQRLFGLFLKNNYAISFATSVADARTVLNEEDINLVLTDLSLVGGESGLDLVEWIRSQEAFSSMPVIALTAHAFVSDRQKCLDAGCSDFITKPIFRSQLLDIIGKNLGG